MPPPQPPPRVPESRPAGLIAIVLSSIFTFKTGLWVSKTVEEILLANGFDDFPNIAGLFSVIAVLIEWALVAHLLQFLIDEYIVIPFINRFNVDHAKQVQRQAYDKETWWERHGFKIAFLVLAIFYLTKK